MRRVIVLLVALAVLAPTVAFASGYGPTCPWPWPIKGSGSGGSGGDG